MPNCVQTYSTYIPRPQPVFKQGEIVSDGSTIHQMSPEQLQSFDLEISSTSDLVSLSKKMSRRMKFLIGFCIVAALGLIGTAVAVPMILTENASAEVIIITTSTTDTTVTTTTDTTVTTTSITTATTTSTTTITTTTTSTTITTVTTTTVSTSTSTTTTTTMIPPNVMTNGGGETGSLSPWVRNSGGNAIVDNGSAGAGLSPRSGTRHFFGGAAALNTLTQNINIFNSTQGYTEAQLDSGTLSAYVVFYLLSYYQSTGNDQGQVNLVFRNSNGTAISTVSTPAVSCTSYCLQSYSYVLPVGTRSIDYVMVFIRVSGTNLDTYFDDNSLKVY